MEHLLFFPVILLLTLIMVILSWGMIFRLLFAFSFLLGVWYCGSFIGILPSPTQVMKEYRKKPVAPVRLANLPSFHQNLEGNKEK